jgi:hypothetical protein
MKFISTLVIGLSVASCTFAANCKTVKSPYKAGTVITIEPNQSGNEKSKAAGFEASIIGSIELIDDCTFKIVGLDTSGIAIPTTAKVQIWGGPDNTLTSDGYAIVDKATVVKTTGAAFTGTYTLDPLAQTQDTKVGASFADFKQIRFYSEQYALFLAYADLPSTDASGNPITPGTGDSTTDAAFSNTKVSMSAVAGVALGMTMLL